MFHNCHYSTKVFKIITVCSSVHHSKSFVCKEITHDVTSAVLYLLNHLWTVVWSEWRREKLKASAGRRPVTRAS